MAFNQESGSTGPYFGNGATTVFSFDFKAQEAADVDVYADGELVDAADYTVSLNAVGGSITFTTAPATGVQIDLVLGPDFEQETAFTQSEGWLADPLNDALDRAAQRDIYLRTLLSRTALTPVGASPISFGTMTSGGFLVLAGSEIITDPATPSSNTASSAQAASSNAAAARILQDVQALKADIDAAIAASSAPDANTQAALTASQQALDAVAEYEGVFDPTSSALDPELSSRVKRIYFENAKAHDLSVSLWRFTSTQIRIDILDEVIDDQVGYFEVSSVDYNNLPARVAFNALDPLSSLPAGDPDAANASPIVGWIEFADDTTAYNEGTLQPAAGEARINRRKIKKRYAAPVAHVLAGRSFGTVLEAGSARTFASPRAAIDSILDVPQPLDNTYTYIPTSKWATRDHQIAVIIDPADFNTPGLPWLENNLFVPSNVSLIARYPNSVFFEHAPGAQRPILQVFGNHLLADIHWKNTEPETVYNSTTSARYAVHYENTHLLLTEYPQSPGDYTQDFKLTILRGSMTVGTDAQIQAFGAANPVNSVIEALDVDLDVEGAWAGTIFAANTSSLYVGGGRTILRGCRDISGRTFDAASGANSTVAVQTKALMPYPNELILDGNRNFSVALSGAAPGMWKLRGNHSTAPYSGIVDGGGQPDLMGYV